jgi:hypothetical protein
MRHDRIEKLGTLFLAVFSTGLALQLATSGALDSTEWAGAIAASLGSISAAVAVRLWPRPEPAPARVRKD